MNNVIVLFLLLPFEVSTDTENTVYMLYKLIKWTCLPIFYHVSG